MQFLRTVRAYFRALFTGRSYGRLQLDEQFFSGDQRFRFLSRQRSPLWRAMLFGVWLYPFTTGGKVLIAGFSLAFLIGAVSVDVPMYQIFVALLALILVTSTVGSLFRWGKLEITGGFPEKATAGTTITGQFTIRNIGGLPLYDLSAGCFLPPRNWEVHKTPLMVPSLGLGETAVIPVALTPLCRGPYVLPPVRVFTTFPFNLNRNQIGIQHSTAILVLPRFHPITTIRLDVGNRYQPGGISLTSNIGESPEYIGNRDYQPGDSLRRIDFRSWGRLARPVVKEYQEEYYCRIALVLDTYVATRSLAPRTGYPGFEAAVSMAASVADALARGEYIIDLFAAGPELHIFRAGRHTAHLENVLEILACVGRCRTNPFDTLGPALINELGQISTVVCVFLDWDDRRRQLVQAAQEAGCHVKVMVVRDGVTTLPISALERLDIAQYSSQQVTGGKLEEL
ncbi:MAG: Secreted protein containing [Planctomycetaceae bacterium]|nr:Secreted protein containing [Planctomycetaceae bacterium]